ncbi:hypothetical protein [Streptomyces sp. NPDC051636]|uniref:Y-family DNA polymerase n=1 Tax=Streptomyces sp. NPDC051636 TaxID=3365663 RepID=UPI003789B3CC
MAVGWIPDFPVIACGTEASEPVAVIAREAVVACSAAARAAGERRRMRLRLAQSRCPDLLIVERDRPPERAPSNPSYAISSRW